MTHSYWLEQSVSVSSWLDSRAGAGATSLDRTPGQFTRNNVERARSEPGKIANLLVILTRFTSV